MYIAAGLVLFSAGDANAQLRIEITEGQVAPTPIAIAEFTGPDGNVTEVGRPLTQIISDDLESSGLFRPVDSAAFIDYSFPSRCLHPACRVCGLALLRLFMQGSEENSSRA